MTKKKEKNNENQAVDVIKEVEIKNLTQVIGIIINKLASPAAEELGKGLHVRNLRVVYREVD